MNRLSIGRAWEEAKAALLAHRRVVVPLLLGLVLIPSVLTAMVSPAAAAMGRTDPVGGVVMLLSYLCLFVAQMALILIVNGWRGSLGSAIRRAIQRLPIYAGGLFLLAMVVALASILALSGTPMATDASGNPDLTRLTSYAKAVFSIALVAIVYISTRILPLAAVAAEENAGMIESFRRSFALTRGNVLRLLVFLLVTVIVLFVVSRTTLIVVGSVVQLLLGRAEPWSVSLLIIAFALGAVQMLMTAIYSGMLGRIAAQLGVDTRER